MANLFTKFLHKNPRVGYYIFARSCWSTERQRQNTSISQLASRRHLSAVLKGCNRQPSTADAFCGGHSAAQKRSSTGCDVEHALQTRTNVANICTTASADDDDDWRRWDAICRIPMYTSMSRYADVFTTHNTIGVTSYGAMGHVPTLNLQ